MFKLVSQKEGFETKIWDFESPDSDCRAKRKTKNEIGAEIAIGKIADKIPQKRKTTNRLTNERSLSAIN